MEEYGENRQVKQSEITYCTVDELKNTQMPDVPMGALTLPETVDFSAVEGVGILHLSVKKHFFGRGRTVREAVWNGNRQV